MIGFVGYCILRAEIHRDKEGRFKGLHFRSTKYVAQKKRDAEILAEIRDGRLDTLRNSTCIRDLPIGARITAAQEYLERGGNGDVKKYAENELRDKHREAWDAIARLRCRRKENEQPNLR